MNAEVLQSTLLAALKQVAYAIETRPAMPVMSNVHLSAGMSRLTLTGMNLSADFSIETWIGANVQLDGAVTLPHKLLKNWTDRQPVDRISILLDVPTQTVKLTRGNSVTNLNGIDAMEYPPVFHPRTHTSSVCALIPALVLRNALVKLAGYVSKEDHRPALCNIALTFSKDKLELAATDAYQLGVCEIATDTGLSSSETVETLLYNDSAEALVKLIGAKNEADLYVCLYKATESNASDRIVIESDNWRFSAGVMSAKFPPYRTVIPESTSITIETNRESLYDALNQAELMAQDNAYAVQLETHDNDSLSVYANSRERGDTTVTITSLNSGEGLRAHYNVQHVMNTLKMINSDTVLLRSNPAGIHSELLLIEASVHDPALKFFALIMPTTV